MWVYHFLNLFFYFEILFLLFVLVCILIQRVFLFFRRRRKERIRAHLLDLIAQSLENKISFNVIKKVESRFILLNILESYGHRLIGEEWVELRQALVLKFLLPTARRWAKSWFWKKRNFAVRVFALSPLIEDESLILSLLDDNSFLVRSIAASAAVKLESKQGVYDILRNINREFGYAKYYYSDILSKGSNQIFSWIADRAGKNDNIHLICLNILSTKVASISTPFLEEDFNSPDVLIRRAALKVAIRDSEKGSLELFLKCLKDPDEKIRVLGATGIAHYEEEATYQALLEASKDAEWSVRLECARSLKKLGKLDLLKDQAMIQYMHDFGDN